MIPIYDAFGEIETDPSGNIIYIETPADTLLADYDDLKVALDDVEIPVWQYIEMWCPIEDRSSKLTAFKFNHSQIKEYQLMVEQFREDGIVRLNIDKSRQMGGSTLVAGLYWTLAIFNVGTKVGIIADTIDKGIGLFKKYKVFYANLPTFLRKKYNECEMVNNATELTFDMGKGRTTSFQVVVQGVNAGASKHFNLLHESEVALWEEIEGTLATLDQTVSDADKGSFIIRETTARGHNHWERVYNNGKARRGSFRSIFVPWYWEPSYSARYDGHPLSDYEKKLVENHGCSLEQCQFYTNKLRDFGGSEKRMHTEYPTTDIESFMGTGLNAFDGEMLSALELKEPLVRGRFIYGTKAESLTSPISVLGVKWVKDGSGPVAIYKTVPSTHPLLLCVDPAQGGADFWAGHIVDNSDFTQLAVYHEKGVEVRSDRACLQCLLMLAAMQCGCFDEKGNFDEEAFDIHKAHELRAGVTGERNTTEELFDLAWKMGLRRIPMTDGKSGYRTNTVNRKPMIDMLAQILSDTQGKCLSDPQTLSELLSFQYQPSGRSGNEKPMAAGGAHDDLVMSLCGAAYMRSFFPTNIVEERTIPKRRKLSFDPFARNEKQQEKYPIRWRAT